MVESPQRRVARAPDGPVDWWQVVTDLMLRGGLSQREIGARCGMSHSAINVLRNSPCRGEPLYRNGVALLALWMEVCEDRGGIPRLGA